MKNIEARAGIGLKKVNQMEKINRLRDEFKRINLDGYFIPKNDEFFNEYISDEDDDLQYISKFSGSYGIALVLKNITFFLLMGDIQFRHIINPERILKL